MCIIAIYDRTRGQSPDRETLERMIKGNPDGAGVAWNDGARVHFRKGIDNAKHVLQIYNEVKDEALTFVFHARIATSGGVSAQKCHPFPISSSNKALDITIYDGTRPCAFHNGIFRLTPEEGLNDTQTLIKTMLAPLYQADPQGVENGKHDALIAHLTRDNRFVILTPDACRIYGTWHKDDQGAKYSNMGFKPAPLYSWKAYGDGYTAWANRTSTGSHDESLASEGYIPAKYRSRWWND